MPQTSFGEKINFSNSKFIKLKSKGDKITFRLIDSAFYDGKHFLKDGDEWDIRPCSRINDKAECEICELFFKELANAKKNNLDKKETAKLTDPYKASISFYFPVINRETQTFQVFQTTKSVRDAIESEIELGTKVLERDLIVIRTELPGSNYYKLSVVDSAETKPLTKEEEEEFKKGKETNLSDYVMGTQDDGRLKEEVNTDEVNF